MKLVWLSALGVPEQEAHAVVQKMQSYGLAVSAHRWPEEKTAMACLGVREELSNAPYALWVILGKAEAFSIPETRYALSLSALCVQSRRGHGFPMVILQTGGDPLSIDQLPPPLQNAVIMPAGAAGTPAKLVAKVHAQPLELPSAYYFDMVGSQQFGQWFEIRPTRGEWPGIIFGVSEGEIKFQAVGAPGRLPKTSTLNYPMQGLQLEFNGRTYSAWALRNTISTESAYYVKVEGSPGSIIFGAFSEENDAEMYHLDLK